MYNIIHTNNAPKPIGPYSQAIQIKNLVFISGQIPINKNEKIISNNIIDQTEQILHNIKKIIEHIGLTVKNLIKLTIYLTDLKDISHVNNVYKDFFLKNHSPYPARTCIEVSKLPKNSKIEIDAIAIQE